MKLVVNSAYGYLAAGGGLTRFADVDAANEVTRRGREVLSLLCRELAAAGRDAARGRHRRRVLRGPRGVDRSRRTPGRRRGRRRYCRRSCSSSSRGATGRCCRTSRRTTRSPATTARSCSRASRSAPAAPSRSARPFFDAPIARLLAGDVRGVREAYVSTVAALRRREIPTYDVSSRVRLTQATGTIPRRPRRAPGTAVRGACSRADARAWTVGERVRVYRTASGTGGIAEDSEDGVRSGEGADPRDYDVEHYVRILREQFAGRLARALSPETFAAVIADPDQPVAVRSVARRREAGPDSLRSGGGLGLRAQGSGLRDRAGRRTG